MYELYLTTEEYAAVLLALRGAAAINLENAGACRRHHDQKHKAPVFADEARRLTLLADKIERIRPRS